MSITPLSPKGACFKATNDADVGTGALSSLAAEGFPLSTGFDPANSSKKFGAGDTVYSEATGKYFQFIAGATGLCAVLTAAAAAGKFTQTLFVDAGAIAGGNGSVDRPFNTIQGALNAAVAGTLIYVTAGVYTEALVVPQVNNLAIVGAGVASTVIQSAGATTLDFTITGAGIAKFYMADLTLRNTSAVLTNRCVNLDGNAVADAATTSFRLLRVRCERTVASAEAVLLRRLDQLTLQACAFVDTSDPSIETILRNCGSVLCDFVAFGVLRLGYTSANPIPANGRQGYTFINGSGVLRTLFLEGPVFAGFGPDCSLIGDAANLAVDGTGLSATAVPVHHPILLFQNQFGNPVVSGSGKVSITLPATTAGATSVLQLDESRLNPIAGIVAGHITIRATNGVLLQQVSCRNAYYPLSNLGALSPVPVAGAFVIGAAGATNLTVDVRGTFYSSQTVFSVPVAGPTLDRSQWSITGALTLAAGAIAISPPFPSGVTAYNVSVEPAALSTFAITAKANNQFNQQGSVAVAANFTVLRT